ncbi:hypothetical protein [Bacillus sp. OV322]|nr:hypothetical protein [Bacillus sp. OV322]
MFLDSIEEAAVMRAGNTMENRLRTIFYAYIHFGLLKLVAISSS